MKKSFQDYIIEASQELKDQVLGYGYEDDEEIDDNKELINCYHDVLEYYRTGEGKLESIDSKLKFLFLHARCCNGIVNEDEFHHKLEETLIEKNNLYGNSFVETMHLFGDTTVLLIRLYDKIKRFENLIKGNNDTEDVTLDICGYILLYLAHVKQFNEEENECCGCCNGNCDEDNIEPVVVMKG